jgi:hypothetical protein
LSVLMLCAVNINVLSLSHKKQNAAWGLFAVSACHSLAMRRTSS